MKKGYGIREKKEGRDDRQHKSEKGVNWREQCYLVVGGTES